jgi:hypothetical protein
MSTLTLLVLFGLSVFAVVWPLLRVAGERDRERRKGRYGQGDRR